MSARERMIVILAGVLLSLIVTGVVGYLAIVATDTSERSLLIGGLVGSAIFGGTPLFTLLGIGHRNAAAEPPAPPTDPTIGGGRG